MWVFLIDSICYKTWIMSIPRLYGEGKGGREGGRDDILMNKRHPTKETFIFFYFFSNYDIFLWNIANAYWLLFNYFIYEYTATVIICRDLLDMPKLICLLRWCLLIHLINFAITRDFFLFAVFCCIRILHPFELQKFRWIPPIGSVHLSFWLCIDL